MPNVKHFKFACLLVTMLLLRSANVFAQEQPEQHLPVAVGIPSAGIQEPSTEAAEVEPTQDSVLSDNVVDDVASNLTPFSTTIRTAGSGLNLTAKGVLGFNPTTVVCPATHRAGCTIKVEVSALFVGLAKATDSGISVAIGGPGSAILPTPVVAIESTSTSPAPDVSSHSFDWMKKEIPAGSTQTVNIEFVAVGGSAQIGFRAATIQLYLN